ncbi:MAG: tyrosine-type recombinase/integrase [Spirochaetales bacterium]|nr:tyrosine-type recombinase/integrase [Spirochaetales bacterium]
MKSEFIRPEILEHVLFALTPENALVIRVCLKTGLRVGDVVAMATSDLEKGITKGYKITITEQKTRKKKTVSLGKNLTEMLLSQSGRFYVFEHRTDITRHRTRQAVYKDIKRAGKLFRIKENLTPHSVRKIYAVKLFEKYGNIAKVRQALNHSNDEVTMIYALADHIQELNGKKK